MPLPIYPTTATSAYWAKLQADDVLITEIIEIDLPGGTNRRWTTSNGEITYTLSGVPTIYVPMLGNANNGIEESIDLGVSVVDFTLVNTGLDLQALMASDDFAKANVKIGRVFVDTPNLGRMQIYEGQMGDFSHNRNVIKGEARNVWQGVNVMWPQYTYREKCAWRFGGTGCGFNTSSITVSLNSINVGSSTPMILLVASGYLTQSYANGRMNFGRVTITNGPNSGHIRTVRQHSGDLLTLSHPLPVNSLASLQMTIYPGCNKRLIDDCTSLYNNNSAFFGWPWLMINEQAS